jgi:hypothetical protein
MIEGTCDGLRRNHFWGPVSPERSSAMMSMAAPVALGLIRARGEAQLRAAPA